MNSQAPFNSELIRLQSDRERINYFQQAVRHEIQHCDSAISQKEADIDEYRGIQKLLEDFSRRLRHDIMVPFGSVGFMPGKLVNTNKVMILLGSNYFADQSTFQASEIIDRRIKYIQDIIDDFKKQKDLALSRLELGSKLFNPEEQNEVEIREPANEESIPEAKGQRKGCSKSERVVQNKIGSGIKTNEVLDSTIFRENDLTRSNISQISEEVQNSSTSIQYNDTAPAFNEKHRNLISIEEIQKDLTQKNKNVILMGPKNSHFSSIDVEIYNKMLARLDELERQEEERREFDDGSSDSEEPSSDLDSDDLPEASITSIKNSRENHGVRFASELVVGPSGSNFLPSNSSQMHYTGDSLNYKNEPKQIVNKHPEYLTPSPKSILRNSNEKSPVDQDAVASVESLGRRHIVPASEEAFTGVIMEHTPPTQISNCFALDQMQTSKNVENSILETNERRVSLFKQSRASQKRVV